jgi:hypothetical protein
MQKNFPNGCKRFGINLNGGVNVGDSKAVIQCGIYIQALNLTEEERQQESAKFKAWYADFQEKHGEELARIRAERETWD